MLSLRSHAVAAVALVAVTPVSFVALQGAPNGPVVSAAAAQTSLRTPTTTPTPTPTPTETATPTPTETPTEPSEPDPAWSPKAGVRFNEPRDPAKSHKINRYIRHAINNTPKGEKIRLVTWNYSNELFVRDIIAAHRRGVSVRLIMANGLAEDQSRQGYFGRTRDALAQGNKRRSNGMKSWARTCRNSCRGREGIQHGKWFMFSKTGGVEKVVMSTSANLTDAAAANQWNDLLTVAGRPVTWKKYNQVFKQMSRDEPVKRPYFTFDDGAYDGWFLPRPGKISNYNVVELLQKVQCRGARGDAGSKGRTVIRVSQSVFNGKPGSAVAARLKALHERGCKIKMVYGVLNNLARDRLKDIPKRTILQDTNGDGFVDRYIHMKALTISGHFDGRRSAHVVYQGSANWSGMSTLSDEQGFVIMSQRLEEKYSKFINWLFKNPPPQGQELVKYIELRRAAGHDPFALVREEMGLGKMQPAF